MTKPMKTIAVLTLLLAGFSAGAITAALRQWGSPAVSVEVTNHSGQSIRSTTIRSSTCGFSSTILGGELAVNQSKTVRVFVCGEGAYSIEVELSDGRRITNRGQYIESGYMNRAVVGPHGIRSTQTIYNF